ncbi:hypothetical protein OG455_29940 [Kitasatospora sp. NBC_01287]|uniref:hypothetical protein n=1 Tax=Kitasatospora sp. NBC_01287 TaxID=2903573 RepID=UPI00224D9222|nr:hypothetical protein [Kitasatospora sp. NBC_01287]MCX4749686.1 hypothetical protein [Kitasatospora sp. NBC_01287]
MRRLLGLLVAAGLLVGVVAVVLQRHQPPGPSTATVRLTGLIGSEKADFFADEQVQQALAAKGLTVSVQHSGSWQMADDAKGGGFDFAFPASSVAAKAISTPITTTPVRPFYSPLVLVAHADTARFLADNGLASQDPTSKIWTFRMAAYLKDVQSELSWSDLTGGTRPPDVAGKIYVATTDPSSSSSAALYLAVMSYLDNGSQVVSDQSGIDRVSPLLRYLIANQGALLASSDQLFRDFVAGTGKPLSWTYESEVAEQAMKGKLPDDTVVLYPDIDIQSDHTLVELTKGSDALAQALLTDPTLIELEARYGFRPTNDSQAMVQALIAKTGKQQTSFPLDLGSLGTFQPPTPTTGTLQALVNAVSATGSS